MPIVLRIVLIRVECLKVCTKCEKECNFKMQTLHVTTSELLIFPCFLAYIIVSSFFKMLSRQKICTGFLPCNSSRCIKFNELVWGTKFPHPIIFPKRAHFLPMKAFRVLYPCDFVNMLL